MPLCEERSCSSRLRKGIVPKPGKSRASLDSRKEGGRIAKDVIKAGSSSALPEGDVYFGRSIQGTPCRVTSTSGQRGNWTAGNGILDECGELLFDTGHQLIRLKSGDPLPPNALAVGVSDPEGSLYLRGAGGLELLVQSVLKMAKLNTSATFGWGNKNKLKMAT